MRAAISDVYSGKKWQRKVEKMHDDQVVAVYNNFLRTGKFEQREPEKHDKKKSRESHSEVPSFDSWTGEQLTIF
jgi:hypothetical protein